MVGDAAVPDAVVTVADETVVAVVALAAAAAVAT